jgi:hypothetical protein
LDAHSFTRERGAVIDFLFEDGDPSAAGNQNCPIVDASSTYRRERSNQLI